MRSCLDALPEQGAPTTTTRVPAGGLLRADTQSSGEDT